MRGDWYELIMGDENRAARPLIVTNDELFGFDYERLTICVPADDWNPQSRLQSTSTADDGEADDLLANALGLPIMSERLQAALARADVGAQDLQLLPIQIFQSSGEEVPGFSVANIVSRVHALNREHSTMLDVDEYESDPITGLPRVLGVWTAALKRTPLDGHDIIRLTEFLPAIFTSLRFANVFMAGGFTGATLRPVPVCEPGE